MEHREEHEKKDEAQPWQPGLKPVLELLEHQPQRVDQVLIRKGRPKGRAGEESARILDLCRKHGIRFSLVTDEVLSRDTGASRHQGVAARLRETARASWDDLLADAPHAPLPLLVALDQVQDPGNVGALARTLYALGGAGLVLPRHNSAFLGPGARRSSAGALDKLPIAEVVNLARAVKEAQDAGFTTYAARKAPEALNPLTGQLRLPALLVLGNEEHGIRPGVAKHCDFSLEIPFLRPFDSLNVAQAGAVILAGFMKQTC